MNPENGHLEFTNIRLVHGYMDIMNIIYCRIELDHEVSNYLSGTIFDTLYQLQGNNFKIGNPFFTEYIVKHLPLPQFFNSER